MCSVCDTLNSFTLCDTCLTPQYFFRWVKIKLWPFTTVSWFYSDYPIYCHNILFHPNKYLTFLLIQNCWVPEERKKSGDHELQMQTHYFLYFLWSHTDCLKALSALRRSLEPRCVVSFVIPLDNMLNPQSFACLALAPSFHLVCSPDVKSSERPSLTNPI